MSKKYKFKRDTLEYYTVISNEDETKNVAIFKDRDGKKKYARVKRSVRTAFDIAKKEDKSQQNKYDKYIEHIQLDENALYKRAFYKEPSIEEKYIENQNVTRIIREIWKLPAPQNRRVYMKVVDGFTYSQIGRIEKVDRSVAKRSVDAGINKLQKKLKNFYFTDNIWYQKVGNKWEGKISYLFFFKKRIYSTLKIEYKFIEYRP